MLVCEQLALEQRSHKVQVFATDLDERAIGIARSGSYPEAIVTDEQRLQQVLRRARAAAQVAVGSVLKRLNQAGFGIGACGSPVAFTRRRSSANCWVSTDMPIPVADLIRAMTCRSGSGSSFASAMRPSSVDSGRPSTNAPAAASQIALVGVRLRLLMRCQNAENGSAPSREKAKSMREQLVRHATEQKNCPTVEISSTTQTQDGERAWLKMVTTAPPAADTSSASWTATAT